MAEHSNLTRIFLSPPHMGGEELRFVQQAFESNYIAPLGPQVDAFEQEFAEMVGISHALALSSGTAAMHLALRVLGVRPGDEVIASSLTFIGSVSPKPSAPVGTGGAWGGPCWRHPACGTGAR